MIIDIHTHTFPDKIADRAIAKLSAAAHIANRLGGTFNDLQASTNDSEIDSCSYKAYTERNTYCGCH